MVDFSAPNLCGANSEFNKLMSKFDDIKKLLSDNIEAAAGDLAAALDIDMDVLDVNLRLLVAKLPSIGSIINLQSEITSLLEMSPTSTAYIDKVADLADKFGISLSANGFSLDSLISGAASDLAAGLDLCGNVPNFELPANASEAVQKAKSVLQAVTAPEKEIKSIAKVQLNSAIAATQTVMLAKVASFTITPSTAEGVISGIFKTATKTNVISYPAGITVNAITLKNIISTTKTLRANYAPEGFTDQTENFIEEFDSGTGTLTETPVRIASVRAYSSGYPPPPSEYAGKKAVWVEPFDHFGESDTIYSGEEWFYDLKGKNITIVDHTGNAIGNISKLKVNYHYLSNYDPRWVAEEV